MVHTYPPQAVTSETRTYVLDSMRSARKGREGASVLGPVPFPKVRGSLTSGARATCFHCASQAGGGAGSQGKGGGWICFFRWSHGWCLCLLVLIAMDESRRDRYYSQGLVPDRWGKVCLGWEVIHTCSYFNSKRCRY